MQRTPALSTPTKNSQMPQVIAINKTQITLVVAIVTIVFAIVNFTVGYVERATATPHSPQTDVLSILNQQTGILSKMSALVEDTHDVLSQRTITINKTQQATEANSQALAGISILLTTQADVLRRQTEVLQKLSIWLDMQIKKGG